MPDKYKITFETWNKLAVLYQDKFMNLDLYNESYNYFIEMLHSHPTNILEIGCGPGNISKYLLSKRADLNITGIDVAPNMILLAKENNPTAQFIVMDCRNMDKLEFIYNGIVCGFCLPYLSDTDVLKLIKDCNRLLESGGVLYISFVEGDYNKSEYLKSSTGDATYFYYHPLQPLLEILTDNHFILKETFLIPFVKKESETEMHTLIIAQKID